MDIIPYIWYSFLFFSGFFAGILTGNFLGKSKAETLRYKYLNGGLK